MGRCTARKVITLIDRAPRKNVFNVRITDPSINCR